MKTFKEYLSEDTKFHKYSKNTLEELELLLKHHKEDLEEYDEEGECNRDEILKDIEEIEDAIASKSTNEAINKANWDGLKSFMKKQPGFSSWEFEGDYEELVITFKKNIQAINAFKKSNASYIEVSAFGQSSASNSEIRVELSKEAMKAMEVNEEIKLDASTKKGIDKLYKVYSKDANGDLATLHSIIRSRYVNNKYTRASNQEIDYIWSLYKKEK